MENEIIINAHIRALDGAVDDLNIQKDGVGFISGKAKYHIRNSSVVKLIKVIAEEINYDNNYPSYGEAPRQILYWSFNGHGLDSPDKIRKELTNLIEAAKETLSTHAEG